MKQTSLHKHRQRQTQNAQQPAGYMMKASRQKGRLIQTLQMLHLIRKQDKTNPSILYLELDLAWCCSTVDGVVVRRGFRCKDQWGGRSMTGVPRLLNECWE
ncbi:hypothetical protein TNCV_2392981 [Trichonephila clavipes]|nr:hypothetical protein TNCV_2392981 [Trichonephila clavipes]